MRRTSLVLAVVAAMVTVLVFTAPAFALPSDTANPQGPSAGKAEGIGGQSDPKAPANTVGGLASGLAHHTIEEGGPPGYHVMHSQGRTPGELVQECSDLPFGLPPTFCLPQ
jgi:hypothetical protein